MKKVQIALFFLLFSKLSFGQDYLLPNEEVLFSFETKAGKKMILAKDKHGKYIVYRFGTSKKIELEYPEKNKESWNKFTFAYYSRGGGVQNLAMDLNNVFFKIGNFEYSIHENYYSESNENDVGITIRNTATEKTSEIYGKYNSVKGSLYKFRSNKLLKIDEDRID
ncbi:hypothetical protein [Flavobacterium sangjuense]|uniref:Uncharacterized protein n=1 Tax=Flavobacterium sangjuense TaxID=2518177 RepID=A0A4P7PTU5_9FLAO|nr:hypothetical protein [Flavobacterium sangjuense]QBZ97642.1 hypothetical protein GS03_01140 [Flavobacterium sangjuense]